LPKGWMSDACPHTEVPVPIGTSWPRLLQGPTRLPPNQPDDTWMCSAVFVVLTAVTVVTDKQAHGPRNVNMCVEMVGISSTAYSDAG